MQTSGQIAEKEQGEQSRGLDGDDMEEQNLIMPQHLPAMKKLDILYCPINRNEQNHDESEQAARFLRQKSVAQTLTFYAQ